MTAKKGVEEYGSIPGTEPSYRGKVRDIYDLGEQLLIVASDRVSAYDSILPTLIPGKGIMLNMISSEWFGWIDTVPNHLVTTDVGDFPAPFNSYGDRLGGRAMLVRKAQRIDLECIVRGYITGSGWREYQKTGSVCGIRLPDDLALSQKLAEPIFTPSTKADEGHDENISFEQAASIVGREQAEAIKLASIEVYLKASEYAASKGIIIADTKFEFGVIDDRIVMIDEALTPDSSRFWLAEEYEPGRPQKSLDKQFVRDFLDQSGWDHNPPAPELPPDIVRKTAGRYRLAVERLFPDLNIERFLHES